jgi:hypothetical protein
MTPKQKANQLIKRMTYYQSGIINEKDKQFSLIAVDEIIDTLNSPPIKLGSENHTLWKSTVDYWQQVKTEIETL